MSVIGHDYDDVVPMMCTYCYLNFRGAARGPDSSCVLYVQSRVRVRRPVFNFNLTTERADASLE